jgi:DNA recombination protein RmuC
MYILLGLVLLLTVAYKYKKQYDFYTSEIQIRDYKIIELETKLEAAATLNLQVAQIKNELKEESENNFTKSLYKLSSEILKSAEEKYKNYNQELSLQNIKAMDKTVGGLNEQFEKIINKVTILDKDVHKSEKTLNLIKESLLSPGKNGALAEITLENILKSSQLRKDIDYLIQPVFKANSSIIRPDAVVFLPDDNILVIDAKSTIFTIPELFLESDQINASELNDMFIKSMNNHLKTLSSKDYRELVESFFQEKGAKINHVILAMFVPTEQVIEKSLSIDPNFLYKAWQAQIYPVGPLGLINMLNIAKMNITERIRNENYEQVLDNIKKLLKSLSISMEHVNKLGSSILSVANNYDKLAGSLNRNILSKYSDLQKYGIENFETKAVVIDRIQVNTIKNSDLVEVE